MRIGLVTQLHGRPDGDTPAPSWESISRRATTAEAVGFDMFVFEDALLYRGEETTDGVWESVSIAAALAATTSTINLGQSVINSPYRSPAMTAKIADTIDEISGGRFVLGIGAGNTEDSDYEAFGFPTDRRYSRFAEAIQIIHGLLRNGEIDFEGEFYTARLSWCCGVLVQRVRLSSLLLVDQRCCSSSPSTRTRGIGGAGTRRSFRSMSEFDR